MYNKPFSGISNATIENSRAGESPTPRKRNRELSNFENNSGDMDRSSAQKIHLSTPPKPERTYHSPQKKRILQPVNYQGMENIDE